MAISASIRRFRSRPGDVARLAVIGVVMLSGCARLGVGASQPAEGSSPGQATSVPAGLDEPLPVPEGFTIAEVVDPTAETGSVSADEAVASARATMGSWVGTSPLIQLVRLGPAEDRTSDLSDFTGWVILSTDVPDRSLGGIPLPEGMTPAPETIYATYTWVWVTLDGEVLGASQTSYETPESVPDLPDS